MTYIEFLKKLYNYGPCINDPTGQLGFYQEGPLKGEVWTEEDFYLWQTQQTKIRQENDKSQELLKKSANIPVLTATDAERNFFDFLNNATENYQKKEKPLEIYIYDNVEEDTRTRRKEKIQKKLESCK